MSTPNQTAVDWLIEQTRTPDWHSLKRGDIIEQAREMEQEQLTNLVQWLMDYTRESHNILGHDDRDAFEFVEIYLNGGQHGE
jgi:hypothetical protein